MTKSDTLRSRRVFHKFKAVTRAGGKCTICGYNKNITALVFHHVHEKTMSMSSSNLAATAMRQVTDEMNKCILLCHNCHSELHYPELTMKKVSKLAAAVDSKLMSMSAAFKYFVYSPEEESSEE